MNRCSNCDKEIPNDSSFCPFCGRKMTIVCESCGKEYLSDFKFCPNCGHGHDEQSNNTTCNVAVSHDSLDKSIHQDTIPSSGHIQKKRHKSALAVIIACIIVAGGILLFRNSGIINGLFQSNDSQPTLSINKSSEVSESDNKNNPLQSDSFAITELANSVLYIDIVDDSFESIGSASGFIIDEGTTLVTNFHVIEDAYSLKVYTADGKKSANVSTLLAYDENKDLAILKLDSAIDVQPLSLSEAKPKQGDSVFAIGYPLGLANTVSDGIVSSVYTDTNGTSIIQITAPISHGSSGGALINDSGNVVGVICAFYTEGQNLNIAVSVSELTSLLTNAKSGNSVSLASFYNRKPHVKFLQAILDNKDMWVEKEIIVQGYVSSVDCPHDGEYFFCLVYNPDDITGMYFHGYPFQNKNEEAAFEYEWNLLSHNKAIDVCCFSNKLNDYYDFSVLEPGSIITVQGTLHEEENSEALHDTTAVTMYLDNVKLLEWE